MLILSACNKAASFTGMQALGPTTLLKASPITDVFLNAYFEFISRQVLLKMNPNAMFKVINSH